MTFLEPSRHDAEADGWREPRTLPQRLFPGPSAPLGREKAERMRRLIESRQPPSRTTGDDGTGAAARDEQTELLRAILASALDAQVDARATAQNSRTFAWAGTVIALLTFIASVALVLDAVLR